MIKLAAIVLLPVLTATYYAHQDESTPSTDTASTKSRTPSTGVEEHDRQFLASLDRESAADRADRHFLADLEFNDHLTALRTRNEIPVLRAIPVEHTAPASAAVPVTRAQLVNAVPATASPAENNATREIRRAIPVTPVAPVAVAIPATTTAPSTDLRASMRQPFVTMIEPAARPANGADRKRASITIYGDQVVIRQ